MLPLTSLLLLHPCVWPSRSLDRLLVSCLNSCHPYLAKVHVLHVLLLPHASYPFLHPPTPPQSSCTQFHSPHLVRVFRSFRTFPPMLCRTPPRHFSISHPLSSPLPHAYLPTSSSFTHKSHHHTLMLIPIFTNSCPHPLALLSVTPSCPSLHPWGLLGDIQSPSTTASTAAGPLSHSRAPPPPRHAQRLRRRAPALFLHHPLPPPLPSASPGSYPSSTCLGFLIHAITFCPYTFGVILAVNPPPRHPRAVIPRYLPYFLSSSFLPFLACHEAYLPALAPHALSASSHSTTPVTYTLPDAHLTCIPHPLPTLLMHASQPRNTARSHPPLSLRHPQLPSPPASPPKPFLAIPWPRHLPLRLRPAPAPRHRAPPRRRAPVLVVGLPPRYLRAPARLVVGHPPSTSSFSSHLSLPRHPRAPARLVFDDFGSPYIIRLANHPCMQLAPAVTRTSSPFLASATPITAFPMQPCLSTHICPLHVPASPSKPSPPSPHPQPLQPRLTHHRSAMLPLQPTSLTSPYLLPAASPRTLSPAASIPCIPTYVPTHADYPLPHQPRIPRIPSLPCPPQPPAASLGVLTPRLRLRRRRPRHPPPSHSSSPAWVPPRLRYARLGLLIILFVVARLGLLHVLLVVTRLGRLLILPPCTAVARRGLILIASSSPAWAPSRSPIGSVGSSRGSSSWFSLVRAWPAWASTASSWTSPASVITWSLVGSFLRLIVATRHCLQLSLHDVSLLRPSDPGSLMDPLWPPRGGLLCLCLSDSRLLRCCSPFVNIVCD